MFTLFKKDSATIAFMICLTATMVLYPNKSVLGQNDKSPDVASAEINNKTVRMHPVREKQLASVKGESCEQTLANISKLEEYLGKTYSDRGSAEFSNNADIERVYANRRTWKVYQCVSEGNISDNELKQNVKARIQRLREFLAAPPIDRQWREGMTDAELMAEIMVGYQDFNRERIGLCSVLFLAMISENPTMYKDALVQAMDWQEEMRPQQRARNLKLSNRFLLETWMIHKVGLKNWTEDTPVPKLLKGIVTLKRLKPITKWDARFTSFDPPWAPGGQFKLNPKEVLFNLPLFEWNINVSESQLTELLNQLTK